MYRQYLGGGGGGGVQCVYCPLLRVSIIRFFTVFDHSSMRSCYFSTSLWFLARASKCAGFESMPSLF